MSIKFNVNIVNESDTEWSPVLKLPTEKSLLAERDNVLLANIPSGSYWEFVIKGDEKGVYYSKDYFFKVKAHSGNGVNKREIKIVNQSGEE